MSTHTKTVPTPRATSTSQHINMALAITTHALIAPQRNFRQRQPKNFTGFSVRVVRGGSSQAFLAKPRVLRARTVRVHAEAKEVVSAEEIQGTATTVPTWNADKDLGAIVADQEKALSKVRVCLVTV